MYECMMYEAWFIGLWLRILPKRVVLKNGNTTQKDNITTQKNVNEEGNTTPKSASATQQRVNTERINQ